MRNFTDTVTELKHENENLKKCLERTEAKYKAVEVALQSLDQVKCVIKENSHLKKTTQQLATQLAEQNLLDDNFNVRCFLDSYLAFKGYQGRGRKKFIKNCFGDGSPLELLYEKIYRSGRPNIHSTSHERPYARSVPSAQKK